MLLVVLLVLLLLAQFPLVLLRHVATNEATGCRSNQTMMMRVMSGNAANDCALDAALGVCRNRCKRERRYQERASKNRSHVAMTSLMQVQAGRPQAALRFIA